MSETNRYRLLLVDDEVSILNTLQRQLRKSCFELHIANSGKEALEILEQARIHIVISDMRMPEMSGAELLSEVKHLYPNTIRILLTGYSDMESTITAINEGGIFSYVTKPWNRDELSELLNKAVDHLKSKQNKNKAIKKLHNENQKLTRVANNLHSKLMASRKEVKQVSAFMDMAKHDIEQAYDMAVEVFANLIDLKMPGENGVNREVAQLCEFVGRCLQLPESEIRNLRLAGMLHNIGQIGLPFNLLSQPISKLDEKELEAFMQYPRMGEQALMVLEPLQSVTRLIRLHKEYRDGSGYPDQLCGSEIPLSASILTAAVDFKAYIGGRINGEKMSEKQAARSMEDNSERYDKEVLGWLRKLSIMEDLPDVEIQLISPHALQDGMRIAEDIYTDSGILMLSQGHQLTQLLISKLMNIEGRLRKSVAIYADSSLDLEEVIT